MGPGPRSIDVRVCHKSFDRRALGFWACLVVLAAGASASADTQDTKQPKLALSAAGNDKVLWLMVGQWDPEFRTYVHTFAVMDAASSKVVPGTRIPPQRGTAERVTAVGETLHVFYGPDAFSSEDGAHFAYDRHGGGRALSLPGAVMPVAIAGEPDGSRPRLWAVVPTATADAVRKAWEQRRQAETVPADPGGSSSSSAPTSQPATALAMISALEPYWLVEYDGAFWNPGFPAPAGCADAERMWLATAGGRLYLFWQADPADTRVCFARYEKDTWLDGPHLAVDRPPVEGFAAVVNARLIFGSLYRPELDSSVLAVDLWTWHPGGTETPQSAWSRLPALLASPGKNLELPAGAVLGAFADKLAVLQAGDKSASFALFSPMTGGVPDRAFEEVPIAFSNKISKTRRNLRDLATTLVVAALLLLVFWRRQESIAAPIPLPAGVGIAGVAKRGSAALIDMLPAAVTAVWIWYQPLRAFIAEVHAAGEVGQSDGVEVPTAVIYAWICYAVVYVVWCIVFEMVWQTTPGKRLFGCEVRHENTGRPNAVQIIIRNLAKLIELMPYLQIWPFMLVVFFTRNHQRVGDLLAHTIVVEEQQVVADGGDGYDDRDN